MKKAALLFLILALLIVYWQWFIPGPKVATDYPIISSSALKPFYNIPQLWSEYGAEGLGEYTVFTLWSWPFVFVSSVFANLGFGFEFRERFLIIFPFLIFGLGGMWMLGKEMKFSHTARFITTLFYLTNTYILTVLDGGQLTIGLAYSLFPISFLVIKKSIQGGLPSKILAGLSIWIIGFLDFRFTYVMALFTLIYFIFELMFLKGEKRINWITGWLKTGIVSGFILIGLNAYWLIPIIKVPLAGSVISSLIQTDYTSYINLGHPMLMLTPNWFINVFGVITKLRFEFVLITAFAFLAPILRSKDKALGFWLILALISIFLTKGTAEPFGSIYKWFYLNIPGFSLFRDSTKFFFLVAISYAVLIGTTTDEILRKIKSRKFIFLKIIFPLAVTAFLLLTIWPAPIGVMTGTFSSPPLEKEYSKLNKYFEEDRKFSRVFWIPAIAPQASLTASHPHIEASRLVQKRPFSQGVLGTYEIFNFLREAPYMGEIFDVSAISYIVYPSLDLRRGNLHPDNINYYHIFSAQLTKLPWLKRVEESPVALWKTKSTQDKLFITPNLWWVIGSDSIYNEATKSAKLKLSKNALIFPQESPDLGRKLDEFDSAKIVLNNKTALDLAASFLDAEELIFPAKQLSYNPDSSGWWKRETKDLISFRFFLRDKYAIDNQDFDLGGGWAIGEGKLELTIKNLELRKDNILLARVMESSRSGELKFYQNGRLIGDVITRGGKDANIRWFEVGQLKSNGELSIESEGDINVMNALALLNKSNWESLKSKAEGLKNRIVDFDETYAEDLNPKVTYEEITPTKYKVNITNLAKPSFLIFSQTYHPLWRLDNEQSIPVYSLLNGFRVGRDGDYILEFEPQKLVLPSFIISGLTLFVSILLLLKIGKLN